MLYKIGDRVRMITLSDADELNEIRDNDSYFPTPLKKLCDKVVTIKDVMDTPFGIEYYRLEEMPCYMVTAEMFDGYADVMCSNYDVKLSIDDIGVLTTHNARIPQMRINGEKIGKPEKIEVVLDGYEVKIEDDKVYLVKKPEVVYPDTYEDCLKESSSFVDKDCPLTALPSYSDLNYNGKFLIDKLECLRKLCVCYDHYLRLYDGNYDVDGVRFVLELAEDEFKISEVGETYPYRPFSFPTRELAEKFLTNFESLIIGAKYFF